MLNNRELAVLIWVAVFIALGLCYSSIRKSVMNLIKLFFQGSIIIVFLLLAAYTLLCVWGMSLIGFWNWSFTKDTIIWFFAVPLLTLVKIDKISSDKLYFKSVVKDLLAFSTIAEFLLNYYTFSIYVELVFVPGVILIGLLLATSQQDPKYIRVQSFFKNVLALIGSGIILYTMIQLINHINEFTSFETFKSFLLSPILTVLFLPCTFLLILYLDYDRTLTLLKISIKDPVLLKKARRDAMLRFHFDRKGLDRWRLSVGRKTPLTEQELSESIDLIKELQQNEINPIIIPASKGWSPYKAKGFLNDIGIATGNYDNCYDDEYFACSRYIEINKNEILPDNISYYIEGKKELALGLKLVLHINTPVKGKNKSLYMLEYASALSMAALGKNIHPDIKRAIIRAGDHVLSDHPFYIAVKKTNFVKPSKGYMMSFTIAIEANYLKD